jgi:DUF4097 and DUF4098 domain-containing protein YvlB
MSTNALFHPPARAGRVSSSRIFLWILLIIGFVCLSFAAALHADGETLPGTAARHQDFTASGTLKSLTVENVNGSVEIVAGVAFAATVDLTVRAKDDREAKRILDETVARFSNEGGDLTLVVEPAGTEVRRGRKGGWDVRARRNDGFRVDARCRVTLPPGVAVRASLVNGSITAAGIAAELALSSVNGKVEVAGARNNLKLSTVNGNVDAQVSELPKGTEIQLKSVNGNLALNLPAAAGFRFEGKTMSGEIFSTFSLPTPAGGDEMTRAEKEKIRTEKEKVRTEKEKIRVEVQKARDETRQAARERRKAEDDGDADVERIEIDLSELNRSLEGMNRDLARMSRELGHNISINLNRSYEATVAGGGATVRMSNLNGKILLLAEGTTESQAKAVVGPRRVRIVEIPRIATLPPVPAIPAVPAVPSLPREPLPPSEIGSPVVRGDIAGDFSTSVPLGDVTLGHVTGKVRVATHSGQIEVKSAGKGADLSTAGGDISIAAVTGDLTARTYGGDIRAGSVSGEARLETTGGDIVLKSGAAGVTARTGGGDVTLHAVRGPVVVRTSGGSVLCEITGTDRPSVEISSSGGDVTLVLPANARGDVEVSVAGVESDGDYIDSQFPDLSISKKGGRQSAAGKLNGGGSRISVRATSGTVRIRKGPPAS